MVAMLSVEEHVSGPDQTLQSVSVELKQFYYRIRDLKKTPAKVKFLSCEPLLGPLPDMPLDGIDWVIVGGESGPKARPIEEEWVIDILKQCKRHNVAFFFKQWGGVHKWKNGRKINGREYNEFPADVSLSR